MSYPYPHLLLTIDIFIYITLTIFFICTCIHTSISIENEYLSEKIKDFKDLKNLINVFRIICSYISYIIMIIISSTSCSHCAVKYCYSNFSKYMCWKRFTIVLRVFNFLFNFASFILTIITLSSCSSNKGKDDFKINDNIKTDMNTLLILDIVNLIIVLLLSILCLVTFSIYMKYFRSPPIPGNAVYNYQNDCFTEDCNCDNCCDCKRCCVNCCKCSYDCCECSFNCIKECIGCLCCCWCCFGCCGCDYCLGDDNNNNNVNNNNNNNVNNNNINNNNNYNNIVFYNNVGYNRNYMNEYIPNPYNNQYYPQNVPLNNSDNRFYQSALNHFKDLISQYYYGYNLEGNDSFDAIGNVYLNTINNLKILDINSYNRIIEKPLYEMLEELYPFSIQYLNNSIESGQIQTVGFATKNARLIRFKTHSDSTIENKFKEVSMKVYALAINSQRMNN